MMEKLDKSTRILLYGIGFLWALALITITIMSGTMSNAVPDTPPCNESEFPQYRVEFKKDLFVYYKENCDDSGWIKVACEEVRRGPLFEICQCINPWAFVVDK